MSLILYFFDHFDRNWGAGVKSPSCRLQPESSGKHYTSRDDAESRVIPRLQPRLIWGQTHQQRGQGRFQVLHEHHCACGREAATPPLTSKSAGSLPGDRAVPPCLPRANAKLQGPAASGVHHLDLVQVKLKRGGSEPAPSLQLSPYPLQHPGPLSPTPVLQPWPRSGGPTVKTPSSTFAQLRLSGVGPLHCCRVLHFEGPDTFGEIRPLVRVTTQRAGGR